MEASSIPGFSEVLEHMGSSLNERGSPWLVLEETAGRDDSTRTERDLFTFSDTIQGKLTLEETSRLSNLCTTYQDLIDNVWNMQSAELACLNPASLELSLTSKVPLWLDAAFCTLILSLFLDSRDELNRSDGLEYWVFGNAGSMSVRVTSISNSNTAGRMTLDGVIKMISEGNYSSTTELNPC
jgi:hypothetical protein